MTAPRHAKRQPPPPPKPETASPTPAGVPVIEGLLRPLRAAADALLTLSDALAVSLRQLPPADHKLVLDLAEDVQTMASALTRYRQRTRELVPVAEARVNARTSRFSTSAQNGDPAL